MFHYPVYMTDIKPFRLKRIPYSRPARRHAHQCPRAQVAFPLSVPPHILRLDKWAQEYARPVSFVKGLAEKKRAAVGSRQV